MSENGTEQASDEELVVVGKYGYLAEDDFGSLSEAQKAVGDYDKSRPEHAPHGVENRSLNSENDHS
ncbi:hypothetical protein [Salinibaculum rarum]|uniref:hypothetical protein n=1 Tax=Salinibaculum rarum TaxID=3058903 RepID=UPI00266003D0|nr:hypothetical protein [Salinibaculum sp. KK48]